ncbi:Exocyst complex protein EXO70 [Nakaseomyces glabratus]|nr:Exocyst complex protein EXO70 [Nakaseomyces glabratus]SLM10807.1 Exocyst complex protein EXO70 [Nakaseomyces glabratus]
MNEIDVDEADILVLSQGLEKTSRLTHQVNKSLAKISKTSAQSSQLFGPILARNNVLKTLQRNIDSTLNSVASVKDLANEASNMRKGIASLGLKPFTVELHKLEDMYQDMSVGNSRHTENAEFHGILKHLKEMITSSEEQLELEFIQILKRIEPFDPQINMEKKIPFPYYSDEDISQMLIIFNYFYVKSEDSRMQDIFIRERGDQMLKSMAFMEPFAKKVTSSKNAPYEKGSSGFINYTEAVLGFIANERSLIDDVFSQFAEIKPRVLRNILDPIVAAFCKVLMSDLIFVKSNIDNAGLFSFELTECISGVQKSVKGMNLKNQMQLIDADKQVKDVTRSLFKDTVDRIKSKTNQMTTIPSDNGVTEATVDTMSRLRKFSEYKTGCLAAMESISRDVWLSKSFREKEYTIQSAAIADNETAASLLSCFLSDCIDTLVANLERRAQTILMPNQEPDVANPNSARNKFKQRIGFLVLMNMTLVEQIVEKSELSVMLVADWKDLTVNLMDTVVIDSVGKKSKDKEQIKEKFRRFNEGFEDLISRTKQYKLSDPALKRLLKSEIVALLMPMYDRFYGRYKDSFKNPRKHIKYTPDDITNVISQTLR